MNEHSESQYWLALDESPTTKWKHHAILAELARAKPQLSGVPVFDIGCGKSCFSVKVAELLGSKNLTRIDKIPLLGRCKEHDATLLVNDVVRNLFDGSRSWAELDAGVVLLLDVLHEVYSFATPKGEPIDHQRSLAELNKAFSSVVHLTGSKGAVVVSDAVLPSVDGSVRVRARSDSVAHAIRFFQEEYARAALDVLWSINDWRTFECGLKDFSIILTQYNKILRSDWQRWEVERYEQHQYMTKEDFVSLFESHGLVGNFTVGTPPERLKEHQDHFEMLEGRIPDTRILAYGLRGAA